MKRTNPDILRFIRDYPVGGDDESDECEGSPMDTTTTAISTTPRLKGFGVPVVDDFFVIDELRNRPYPGETTQNKAEYDRERARRDDRVSRWEVLSQHPHFKFLRMIAGARQNNSVEALFEKQDLDRQVEIQNNALRDRQASRAIRGERDVALRRRIEQLSEKHNYTRREWYRELEQLVAYLRLDLGQRGTTGQYGFIQLLEEWNEYRLALDTMQRPQGDVAQMRRFLEQYERDYGRRDDDRVVHQELARLDDERELTPLVQLALYIRDEMDLNRQSHDAARGTSFIESIEQKVEQSVREPQVETRIKRESDVGLGQLHEATRVKREEVKNVSWALVPVVFLDSDTHPDTTAPRPLVIHTDLLGTHLERIFLAGVDASGWAERQFGQPPLAYRDIIVQYSRAAPPGQGQVVARAIIGELASWLGRDALYTIHPSELNALIGAAREAAEGDAQFDEQDVLNIIRAYYVRLYLTRNNILDVYDAHFDDLMANGDSAFARTVNARLAQNRELLESNMTTISDSLRATLEQIETLYAGNATDELLQKSNTPERVAPRTRIQAPAFAEYYDRGRLSATTGGLLPLVQVEPEQVWHAREGTYALVERARLWIDYADYNALQRGEQEKELATLQRELDALLYTGGGGGDADYVREERTLLISEGRRANTQAINSGVVALNANIMQKIEEAYSLVQRYCPDLRGLPQRAFYSESALACGLAQDFACFVAALDAAGNILHPDMYKSGRQIDATMKNKGEKMQRLKDYAFSRPADTQQPERNHVYRKEKRRRLFDVDLTDL